MPTCPIRLALATALCSAFLVPSGLRAQETPNLQDLERRIEAAKREQAQEAEAQRRQAAEAARKATLVVQSDAPCRLLIDGKEVATVEASRPATIQVPPGQQLLACTSTEQAAAKYQQVIIAQAGQKTVHKIKLASAVASARAEAQRKAEAARKQAEIDAKIRAFYAARASNPACLDEAGNGILRQPATELEWTRSDNGSDIGSNAATSYCAGKGAG